MRFDSDNPITIVRDYDPSIPPLMLDPDMIQQAVLNIVRNSVQALTESQTPNPQIRLITRIERQMTIQTKRHALVAKIKITSQDENVAR